MLIGFNPHSTEEAQRSPPFLPPREEVECLGWADDEWKAGDEENLVAENQLSRTLMSPFRESVAMAHEC